MENELKRDLLKIVKLLNKHTVEYLLVGGTAVGFYGYVRSSAPQGFTSSEMKFDLDFWYKPTISNFHNLTQVLIELGVDERRLNKIVFDSKKTYLRIPRGTYKLEFLCQLSGLENFSEAESRATKFKIDDLNIAVISYNDLIKNKQTVNREVDKRDIKALEKKRFEGDKD